MANTPQQNTAYASIVLLIAILVGVGGYIAWANMSGDVTPDNGESYSSGDMEHDASSRSSAAAVSSGMTASESSAVSSYPPLTQLERQTVEAFLGENIDRYAVATPVGTRTFFVTDISWYTDNSGIVTYENSNGVDARARFTATVTGGVAKIVAFDKLPQ